MRNRANELFKKLGLQITATRAGRYFKSDTDLIHEDGFRWWFAPLPSRSCDRFGVQVAKSTAIPERLDALKLDGYVTRDSGDRVEIYREISFKSDGSSDMDALKVVKAEIQSILSGKGIKIKPEKFHFDIRLFRFWHQSIYFEGSEIRYECYYNEQVSPSVSRTFRPTDVNWQIF